MSRRRPRVRRAFTLIEAIVTIVVLGAMGSITSTIILTATDGFLEASTAAQLHAELSIAMDRAVRELRGVQLDTAAASVAPDINSIAVTDIQWHTPVNRLYRSGTKIYLQVNGGADKVLLENVSNFTVIARNESGGNIALPVSGAACDPVRRIVLQITVTRYGVSEYLRTQVFLRCTMAGAGA